MEPVNLNERLKSVDQTSKDVVFHWISDAQYLLPTNNTYFNIPFGVHVICLLYYSPPFFAGVYEIEGKDESKTGRPFSAKYSLEFIDDGTIFGSRGKQLICGGWNKQDCSINYVLTWGGNCYQYNGTYDSVSKQINGTWQIKDENKRNDGQCGTFKYEYKYKSSLKKITNYNDPNNINNNKLHHEYQTLLAKYESVRKKTSELIQYQQTEIVSLKLLLYAQHDQIEEYEQEINDLKTSDIKEDDNEDTNDEEDDGVNDDNGNDDNNDNHDVNDNVGGDDSDRNGNDDNHFVDWDDNDILQWISTVNNSKFNKYKDVLGEKLKEENVKGNQLCFVDKDDLHRFGVIDFGDKIEIMHHLKCLTNNTDQSSDK